MNPNIAEFLILIVLIIVFVIFTIDILVVISKEKIKPIGEISVSKNEDGNYIWDFSFYDKVTYEAIENMDKVTFKVKKGENDGDNN